MKALNILKLQQKIEEIASYDLNNNNIFGISYCVVQKGETVFKKHYGYCDQNKTTKISDSTMFRLASMTKPITGVAAMILVQKGLISLDDTIEKYIPGFKTIHVIDQDGNDFGVVKNPPTIMHCLTHSSGFGSGEYPEMTDAHRKTIDSTINFLTEKGLLFEPFSKAMYSAYGAFDVVASIVEKVSQKSYSEFLKDEIFVPCNMPDTTFSPTADRWSRMVTMHNKKDDKSEVGITYPGCVFEKIPCEHSLAGAGLASTLCDYVNFAKMLLNQGSFEGKEILTKESVKTLSRPYIPMLHTPEKESWGLGVRVVTGASYERLPVGCFGWSGAYGTHFWVDPQNEICAVMMKNSRFDGGSATMSGQRLEYAVTEALI